MLLHGWYRRSKFPKLTDGQQTYKLRASIRNEMIVGALGLVLMLAVGISSAVGYSSSLGNLQANIERHYSPTQLSLGTFNGWWMNVDITLADGTSFTNTPVEVREDNEPFIEDVWYHLHPKPAG